MATEPIKISELEELTTPQDSDNLVIVTNMLTAPVTKRISRENFLPAPLSDLYPAFGRLTLTSGAPVMGDVADAETVYYTPFNGNTLALYDDEAELWELFEFEEIPLDITGLTASKPHDMFVYNSSGTLVLEAEEWTDGATRATGLDYQDGVLVKDGDPTRRLVGTIYVDSGQRVQNLSAFRYVSNLYNQIMTGLYAGNASNHVYNGAARLWNNSNADNQINFVICRPEGQMMSVGLRTRVKAGADGNYALVLVYKNGAVQTTPYIELSNYNNQYIEAGMTAPTIVSTGFAYFQVYELGNHAASTFDLMNLSASVWL